VEGGRNLSNSNNNNSLNNAPIRALVAIEGTTGAVSISNNEKLRLRSSVERSRLKDYVKQLRYSGDVNSILDLFEKEVRQSCEPPWIFEHPVGVTT